MREGEIIRGEKKRMTREDESQEEPRKQIDEICKKRPTKLKAKLSGPKRITKCP